MSFFDDNDPFEDIVNQFFGARNTRVKRNYRNREESDESTYEIEEKDCIYLIIEIPGLQKEDIKLRLNEDLLEIKIKKNNGSDEIQRKIPFKASRKKFDYTYTNGILEVKFFKK